MEILSEIITYQNGCYRRVQRWVRGNQANGKIIRGFTGWEAVEERDIIHAMGTFSVFDIDKEQKP